MYYGLETSGTEQLYTLTVNGRNLSSRLPTAVALSINMATTSFNQWSISPQMRTFNLIDLEHSPAMQLFYLADDLEDVEWDDPAMEKRACTYWHRHIIQVFRTGKASPFDVDYKTNRPMLHLFRFPARRNMTTYVRLTWDTLHKLNFPEHLMMCNGM